MSNVPAQNAYALPQYLLQRRLKFSIDEHFTIGDLNGTPIFHVRKKGFKLKEDIRVFADAAMAQELLSIQARQVIDWSGAYDILDSTTGKTIGSLRRHGFKSMLRDEWTILDDTEREIGKVFEDSPFMAILRRFLTNLIPQNYDVTIMDQRVADLRQRFNPFLYKLEIDFRLDTGNHLDRRIGLAAAILLASIEGRQRG